MRTSQVLYEPAACPAESGTSSGGERCYLSTVDGDSLHTAGQVKASKVHSEAYVAVGGENGGSCCGPCLDERVLFRRGVNKRSDERVEP